MDMTTPHKLGKNFVYDLLHDALTARIKGTNRPFTHLVKERNGQWKLVRENHMGIAYLEEGNGYQVIGSFVVLREGHEEANEVPLAFNLADYRPCKLGVIKMGDKEIPHVTGGGSVFNFIEDWINQTYQWYIDHDIERPLNDLTHAYDVEIGSRIAAPAPLEEVVEEVGSESTPEPPDSEEDPFGSLYRRDPAARQKQWVESMHVADNPKPGTKMYFPEMLKKAIKEDPIKFDYPEMIQLRDYLVSMNEDEVDMDEVNMIIRFCRSLDEKYTMIRRTAIGSIIAKAEAIEKGTIIYFNPESKMCVADKPTIAFKLKPEFLRFKM